MGLFDRWRRGRADFSAWETQGFEALASDMTRQGVIIITREENLYTVYWARKQDNPLNPYPTVEALKRSVEGKGATVLEGLLDCRAQALHLPDKPTMRFPDKPPP